MAARVDELDALIGRAQPLLDRLRGQVWVKSGDFRFFYVNDAFAASLACTQPEVIGATEQPFFSGTRVAEFRSTDAAALDRDRPIVVPEAGSESPWRRFETLKVPLRSGSGTKIGTLGIAWDVTAWRVIETFVMDGSQCTQGAARPHWLADAVVRLTAAQPARSTGALVAAQLGVHSDSLGRAFRRNFGVKLGQYRSWLRAAKARDCLLWSHASLADVALDAGYADQSHMTREFGRHYGLTPGALRAIGGSHGLAGV